MNPFTIPSLVKLLSLVGLVAFLCACSSVERPKPAELGVVTTQIDVSQVWNSKLGSVSLPLDAKVIGTSVYLASSDGIVAALDSATGKDLWRSDLGVGVSAGVGSDGVFVAVISQENEVIALEAGKEIWRQKISGISLTAPLIAGGRVFVLSADKTVYAFDAQTGRRLWQQQRNGDALVLAQAGVLMAIGDTLLVGSSGRLGALNPQNGAIRWEAAIASSRGTNEVERLVDLVAGVSRQNDEVCVRSYQMAVGCVDARRGTVNWTKPFNGSTGIHGNATTLIATESDGKVLALRRDNGEKLWSSEKLRYRKLTTPLLVGKTIVIGDDSGAVNFLSADNGELMNRIALSSGPVLVAPIVVGQTVVVVTQRGNVFGFRPE